MKVYDCKTGELIAKIVTNHSMTIDEVLNFMGYTVNDDGQLITEDGETINAWYDDLVMDYTNTSTGGEQ